MAEIKQFNTRFQLKYDTYTNWKTNNPKLLKGEIAIATIDENADGVQNAPSVLIKIGDGTHQYNDLKFLSGKAADVYDWAKAEKKPEYKADEIDGLADYISGKVQDTNTKYKIEQDTEDGHKLTLFSQEIGETEWTKVVDITTVDTVYDDTALVGRVTAIEGLVGSDSVATQIANAITALKLAEKYAAKQHTHEISEVNGLSDAIADAKKAGTDASTALSEHAEAAEAKYETKTDASGKLTEAKEYTETEVAAEKERAENIEAGLRSDVDIIKADYLKAADKEALQTQINTIINNPDTEGVINSINEFTQYIEDHGEIAEGFRRDIDANAKAIADKATSDAETYETKTDATGKLTAAKEYAEEQAREAVSGAATYTDECFNGLNDSLHAIAKSGSTDDLVQGTKILVFNCGDSVCEDITIE